MYTPSAPIIHLVIFHILLNKKQNLLIPYVFFITICKFYEVSRSQVVVPLPVGRKRPKSLQVPTVYNDTYLYKVNENSNTNRRPNVFRTFQHVRRIHIIMRLYNRTITQKNYTFKKYYIMFLYKI